MFDRLKKKLEPKEPKVTEEPESTEKLQTTKKPSKEVKKPKPAKEKPAKPAEDTGPQSPQMHADIEEAEKPFVGISEYGSAMEIADKIDNEIAETRSSLGKYLRQLNDKRAVAEQSKRLHDVVAKLANKKQSKENVVIYIPHFK